MQHPIFNATPRQNNRSIRLTDFRNEGNLYIPGKQILAIKKLMICQQYLYISLFISFLAGISLFVAFPIYDHYAKFKVSDAANPTCATVPLISSVNLAGSCW